jgi:hypothetical protein
MNRRKFVKTLSAVTVMAGAKSLFSQGGPPPIDLPRPRKQGGKSVLASLQERRTDRNIGAESLSPQSLSDLLWAAFGVNRDKGQGPFGSIGRTAASASNAQEIDLYVALPEAVYLYEPEPHRLVPVVAGDHRRLAISRGQRGTAAGQAPVNIIFVADIARYKTAGFQEPGLRDSEVQKSYFNVAVGLIAGNVYLYAASQGLAAWFHNCDKEGLAAVLKLRPDQRALYGQTVGYPAKS